MAMFSLFFFFLSLIQVLPIHAKSTTPLKPLTTKLLQFHNGKRRSFFEKGPAGTNSTGRQVHLRGTNVVYKDFPFYPSIETFHSNLSFVESDAKLLQSLGINLIRLSVMWPGVYPTDPSHSDSVNSTYLSKITDLINLANDHGIYTLLDPHQDEMHPIFCGEGAPSWWVENPEDSPKTEFSKMPVIKTFPVPVQDTPFKNSPPSREECYEHSSFSYIFTEDAGRSYQRLYETSGNPRYVTKFHNDDNGNNITNFKKSESKTLVPGPYAKFWQTLVSYFKSKKDFPSVLGGEIWNEPFPGDIYAHPEYRDNHYADLHNLQPWYENITEAIRAVSDSDSESEFDTDSNDFLVAYEPTWPVGTQDLKPNDILSATSGFSFDKASSGAKNNFFKNNIYAFHYYVAPCDPNVTSYLKHRTADADRLEAVPLATEFNLAVWDKDSEKRAVYQFDQFEKKFQVSYSGWQYKSYSGSLPTGTCTGCGNSFYENDGSMNYRMSRSMGGRPMVQYLGGEVIWVEGGDELVVVERDTFSGERDTFSGESDTYLNLESDTSSSSVERDTLVSDVSDSTLTPHINNSDLRMRLSSVMSNFDNSDFSKYTNNEIYDLSSKMNKSNKLNELRNRKVVIDESELEVVSDNSLPTGKSSIFFRHYSLNFTVDLSASLTEDALTTEVSVSELWLDAADQNLDNTGHKPTIIGIVKVLKSVDTDGESDTIELPKYSMDIFDEIESEVVVEDKVVIPGSWRIVVKPEEGEVEKIKEKLRGSSKPYTVEMKLMWFQKMKDLTAQSESESLTQSRGENAASDTVDSESNVDDPRADFDMSSNIMDNRFMPLFT